MNVIAKISCYFEHCRYTKIAQRMFKYSDMQYANLTPREDLQSSSAIVALGRHAKFTL